MRWTRNWERFEINEGNSSIVLAERAGFEPAIPIRYTGFRGRRIRPLCHLSAPGNQHIPVIPPLQGKSPAHPLNPFAAVSGLPRRHCCGYSEARPGCLPGAVHSFATGPTFHRPDRRKESAWRPGRDDKGWKGGTVSMSRRLGPGAWVNPPAAGLGALEGQ